MKRGAAFATLLLLTHQTTWSEETPNVWECVCEKQPCACVPRPPVNPRLCDIICPADSKVVNCSCEVMTGVERQRAREERDRARLKDELEQALLERLLERKRARGRNSGNCCSPSGGWYPPSTHTTHWARRLGPPSTHGLMAVFGRDHDCSRVSEAASRRGLGVTRGTARRLGIVHIHHTVEGSITRCQRCFWRRNICDEQR